MLFPALCVWVVHTAAAGDRPLRTPMEQLVIYEMHVRGFTRDDSSSVSAPGSDQMCVCVPFAHANQNSHCFLLTSKLAVSTQCKFCLSLQRAGRDEY
eukprot:495535-Pelagomonas_calceolata.AAC.4